jgi:uncharacterized membrane protein
MEFEEKVKLLKKARAYWTWGLIINPLLNPFFFIPVIGFILRYLGVRLVSRVTNNDEISSSYGFGLLLSCLIPLLAPSSFWIAISLREAGKELNNMRLIKAHKWYYWSFWGWVVMVLGFIVGSIPFAASFENPLNYFSNIAKGLLGLVALFVFVSFFIGWIYEVNGVWHLHEISEETNSLEIVRKED